MASEPMYTLEQAKKVGLRELCGRRGHDFQHMHAENWGGKVVINYYECGVCDVVVSLSYPNLGEPVHVDPACSAITVENGHYFRCVRERDHRDTP